MEDPPGRFVEREPLRRSRRTPSTRLPRDEYRGRTRIPSERSYPPSSPRRNPSTRQLLYPADPEESFEPLDPYASYIPPPPYFLPPVLRQSSIYGSNPPPPPPPPARPLRRTGTGHQSMMPYSPAYYDNFNRVNSFPSLNSYDPPEDEPDGVHVDFSALQGVHNVSDRTATTLMPSVDAVEIVCANVSRVLYVRTDDLQSKAGASTAEIESTAAELSGFAMILGNLREILQNTSQLISDKAFENINTILLFCKKALQKIQSVITTSRKVPSRLDFIKKNSLNSSLSRAKPVRLNLECLKTSLTAMMSTIVLADRQHERQEVESHSTAAVNSSESVPSTVMNGLHGEISRTIYELDAAVERSTLKLEDDIFANSRAVKRWQDSERREFNSLYIRNMAPDNASPVSPASQWVSTLVPYQPTITHMRRITAPVIPKAIGYGGQVTVASSSRQQIDEREEEARISAVIRLLLTKWTEGQQDLGRSMKHPETTTSFQATGKENIEEPRSTDNKLSTESQGADDIDVIENQDSLTSEGSVKKRVKHVSFENAEVEDEQTGPLSNDTSAERSNGHDRNSNHDSNMRMDSLNGKGAAVASSLTNGIHNAHIGNPSDDFGETAKMTLEQMNDIKEMYGSGNEPGFGKPSARFRPTPAIDEGESTTKNYSMLDELPKAGWEETEDMPRRTRTPADPRSGSEADYRFPVRRSISPEWNTDPTSYYPLPESHQLASTDPYGPTSGNYYSTLSAPYYHRPSPSYYPTPSTSYYPTPSTTYYPTPPSSYYPAPPPVNVPAATENAEETSTALGFAETIRSSSAGPSRSYGGQSQSDRYAANGRYPMRRQGGLSQTDRYNANGRYPRRRTGGLSQAERYNANDRYPRRAGSDSGYSPIQIRVHGRRRSPSRSSMGSSISDDNRQALVLRERSHATEIRKLESDLRDARTTIEQKNAELKNSTDVERLKRLAMDLATAQEDLLEFQAAAERKDDADARNSAAKSEQIAALEAENSSFSEQLAITEASNREYSEKVADIEAQKAAVDAKVTTLEAKVRRRDKTIEGLKREEAARNVPATPSAPLTAPEPAPAPPPEPVSQPTVERLDEVVVVEEPVEVDDIEERRALRRALRRGRRSPSRSRSRSDSRGQRRSHSRSRSRSSSGYSYHTTSLRKPKEDKLWDLASGIVVILGLGVSMSVGLATYLHSHNGIAMHEVLSIVVARKALEGAVLQG